MKTIGLLGGMSWESTLSYYRFINEAVKSKLGGLNSAKIILHSVNFADIEALQRTGDWHQCGQVLGEAAQGLELAGAQFIVICTNTMHKVFEQISQHTSLPVLHVADVVANALKAQNVECTALLGTRFTMQESFYIERLKSHGLSVIVPSEIEQEAVDSIIYQELCLGKIVPSSKAKYVEIINALAQRGAQGVILGCTEIGLLISQQDSVLPLFDTTYLHAQAVVNYAIKSS
ncbi:aspartate/glutamate racemase family protein [Pseudoalteromonas sp. JBTF-M23]|uniref:Aspartate/glutamate racemase family protein n=1 Tax=Pseudoalteromonas caenipelagi TaxID=2726988 RepID=A0A849VAE3_9GAMM|nr:aspartate/glutamate racemase family protein [Pseudoalteromonas caenipelagi]NOU50599.1 aspartate/glutamate racemase family protein [Pseudoalteromonas caenipelagi]